MEEKVKSEMMTVMLIDIVGYTKKTNQLSRDNFNKLHDTFDNIALPIFEQFEGEVVKKMGDAFLVTFKSATNGIRCGIEIQNAFLKYRNESGNNLRVRVALHSGEVLHRHNDVYGDVVNTTARIESATPADQIFFSEAVFSAMNKNEIPFQYLGMRRFKGLKYPVKIFRVKGRGGARRIVGGMGIGGLILTLVLLAILCGAVYFLYKILPML